MSRCLSALVGLSFVAACLADWPGWRGRDSDGLSGAKELPVRWSATKNVRWKVNVPGAGVSAPIVRGDRVFVTSSGARSGLPTLLRSTPFNAGFAFSAAGASPLGIIQACSPVFRSIAVILPHGGLMRGNPIGASTRTPRPT